MKDYVAKIVDNRVYGFDTNGLLL